MAKHSAKSTSHIAPTATPATKPISHTHPFLAFLNHFRPSTISQPIPETIWDKGIYYLALLVIVGTPLIFSSTLINTFEGAKALFVYAIALAMLTFKVIDDWQERQLRIVWGTGIAAIIAFIAVVGISTIFSQQPYISIVGDYARVNGGLVGYVAYAIVGIFILYSLLPRNHISYASNTNIQQQRLKAYIVATLLSLVIVSIHALLQKIGFDSNCLLLVGNPADQCIPNPAPGRFYATMGHPNLLASYVIYCLPLALVGFFSRKKLIKSLTLATIILGYAALWLTYSRAGLIGLAAGLTVSVAVVPWQVWRMNWKWLVSAVIICTAFTVLTYTPDALRLESLAQDSAVNESTAATRLVAWDASLKMITDHPLLGMGPALYGYMFEAYRPLAFNNTFEWSLRFDKPHNEALGILSELGILGFIAWGSLFVLAAVTIYFKIAGRKPSLRQWWSGYWRQDQLTVSWIYSAQGLFLAGIVAMTVSQLLGFASITTNLALFVGLGIIFSQTSVVKSWQLQSVTVKASYSIVILLIMGGAFYNYSQYVLANYDEAKGREYQIANYTDLKAQIAGYQTSLDAYQSAISANSQEPYYKIGITQTFIRIAQALHQQSQPQQADQILTAADQYITHARNQRPNDLQILSAATLAYADMAKINQKYLDNLYLALKDARQKSPHNANISIALASTYQQIGKDDLAKQEYDAIVGLIPEQGYAYYLRSLYEKDKGLKQQYQTDIKQAYKLSPDRQDVSKEYKQMLQDAN